MNKYVKTALTATALYALALILFIVVSGRVIKNDPEGKKAVLALNDIGETIMSEDAGTVALEGRDFGVEYVVLDEREEPVFYSPGSSEGTEINVSKAISGRMPYICLTRNGTVTGYVIITDIRSGVFNALRSRLILVFALLGLVMVISLMIIGIYLRNNIIQPFKRMEAFAGKVAEGRLDEPLTMDRDNLFGAFSESFDIMREELVSSKERELTLQRKEKEMVASLSHDLKTPVTGIKLTAELLKAKLGAASEAGSDIPPDIIEKLDNIYQKADQIDALSSDLFDSALDDLGEFTVNCTDHVSSVLSDILKRYDNKGLVRSAEVPGVIISIDEKRMGQVIGNIISNSEKYAGTPIDVEYDPGEKYLGMRISDSGPGVSADETELITNKFYRGKQWEKSDKAGNGLGLYISRTLMEKMGGKLEIEKCEKGFSVLLLIPLAGKAG